MSASSRRTPDGWVLHRRGRLPEVQRLPRDDPPLGGTALVSDASALHVPRAGPLRLSDSGSGGLGLAPTATPSVQSRRRSLTERGEEGSRETGCPFFLTH